MPLLTSKFRTGLDNLSIDVSQVKGIKLSLPNPDNPRLWVIYFIGFDIMGDEKVIRTWFYQSEQDRTKELNRIQVLLPHLMVL
jgi:hypothetical protein